MSRMQIGFILQITSYNFNGACKIYDRLYELIEIDTQINIIKLIAIYYALSLYHEIVEMYVFPHLDNNIH